MKMSQEMFEKYNGNPIAMDEKVRQFFKLPPAKYYSVSVWPESGIVRVDIKRNRTVPAAKISKSDQK